MAAASLPCETVRIDDLASLIEAEYREMPGMQLTFDQVRRLWNLSGRDCEQVLDCLTQSGLLRRDRQNRYLLRS